VNLGLLAVERQVADPDLVLEMLEVPAPSAQAVAGAPGA
jgi:hypothetical protein